MVKYLVYTYLVTYLLTPWSRILFEKLTSSQLNKIFPAFYGNGRCITAFTSARHLSLFWARSIQSMTPNPTSWRSIFLLASHLCLVLPSYLLPSGFAPKPCIHLSPIRATWPTHLVLLHLITRIILDEEYRSLNTSACNFFPLPSYLVPIRPKYFQTPSAYVPLSTWVTKFHTHKKKQNYSSEYINFYIFWLYLVYIHANNYRSICITHTMTVSQKIIINGVQLSKENLLWL
jgi:hypothetical protein